MLAISDKQFQTAVRDLGEFVKIPSISNQKHPEYQFGYLVQAADWLIYRY